MNIKIVDIYVAININSETRTFVTEVKECALVCVVIFREFYFAILVVPLCWRKYRGRV